MLAWVINVIPPEDIPVPLGRVGKFPETHGAVITTLPVALLPLFCCPVVGTL